MEVEEGTRFNEGDTFLAKTRVQTDFLLTKSVLGISRLKRGLTVALF